MMLKDMHLHTNYSDGKDSMLDMIRCAVELGYEEICFTDHVRKSTDWIQDYDEEIKARKKEFQDRLLISGGVEVKLLDWNGGLDVPEEVFTTNLDIVAAIHRIPSEDGSIFYRKDDSIAKEMLQSAWEHTLLGCAKNNRINRIAHMFNWEKVLSLKEKNIETIQTYADKNKKIQIEYNVKYDNSALPDFIWRQFAERIVIGSDSHSVEEMVLRKKDIEEAYTLFQIQEGI